MFDQLRDVQMTKCVRVEISQTGSQGPLGGFSWCLTGVRHRSSPLRGARV